MADLRIEGADPPESLDARFAAALLPVRVEASLVMEIGWVLWRMERAFSLNDPARLGPARGIPERLIRIAGRFWSDGLAGFTETAVIAHRADVLFESDLDRLLKVMSVVQPDQPLMGLTSERPDERLGIERRLSRLHHDADCRAKYYALLCEVGRWVAARLSLSGQGLVEQECLRVHDELRKGSGLRAVISEDALGVLGLEPLIMAALAQGHLMISPSFFAGRAQVVDLGDVVSFGYGVSGVATLPQTVFHAAQVALKAGLLADPLRARILMTSRETPLSTVELAHSCGSTKSEIQRQLRILRRAHLVQRTEAGRPARYSARPDTVDALLNDISEKLHHGHGRASGQHATRIAHTSDFQAIFTAAPIGIIQFDPMGRCLSANAAACELLGADEEALTQLRMVHLLADEHDLDAFALDGEPTRIRRREARLRRIDDAVFWASMTVSAVVSPSGSIEFAYAMIESIATRRGSADSVTSLPNRALFMDRLHRVIGRRRHQDERVAVLMLDLDGFKLINDTLGHSAGDELLQQVADRLMRTTRPADIVARMGGDEFAVLLADCTSVDDAVAVATKIDAAIALPFRIGGERVSVGVSVGWALSSETETDADALLAEADAAMFVDKRARARKRSKRTILTLRPGHDQAG